MRWFNCALGGVVTSAVAVGLYEFGRRSPELMIEAILLLMTFGVGAVLTDVLFHGEPR